MKTIRIDNHAHTLLNNLKEALIKKRKKEGIQSNITLSDVIRHLFDFDI